MQDQDKAAAPDSEDKAEATPESKAERLLLGKLARVLYSNDEEGSFSKEAWEASRIEYRKSARKMMRAMEKQGLKLVPVAP